MNYLSTDHLIVYTFLICTLAIGLWSGRGIKDIKEYTIANRQFGLTTLLLTLIATNIGGGSVFGASRAVFSNGIIMTVAELGVAVQLLIVGLLVAPKVASFEGCITMGDVMGQLYGETSKIITGLLGALYSVFMTSMQLLALAIIGEALLGFEAPWVIMLGGGLLVLYSAFGGIKSVTFTDVFQFVVLIAFIPILISVMLQETGGIKGVFLQVPAEKLIVFGHENFSYYLTLFLIWSIFPTGVTSPPLFQRLLMGKNSHQLRTIYLIRAAFNPMFRLTIMLAALAGLVLYPDIEAKNVIPHAIHTLLPMGLKGAVITGLLAVIMSTADSYLHAAGVTLTHDVAKPLCDRSGMTINELRWARISTLIIGLFAIWIALSADNMISLSLRAFSVASPLLMFPLVAGIMGLKPERRAFYWAAGVTMVAFIVSRIGLPPAQSHLTVLICIMANGITFFGTHILQHKGLAIVQYTQQGPQAILWKPQSKPILDQLRYYAPTLQNILAYSALRVKKYGAPYLLFGAFCCANFTFPYFMWVHESMASYHTMLYLRFIGATLCGLLIVREKWPKTLLPYFPTFWHLTLLYCIPFTSTIMFLLTKGSTEWLINVAMTIMFLIVLVDWVSFLILTSLGIALGFLFYTQVVGPVQVALDFTSGYLLVYQGVFATLIGLLFARRRQQRFDQLALRNQALKLTDQENKARLLESNRDKARILQALRYSGTNNLIHLIRLATTQRRTLGEVDSWETLPTTTAAIENMLVPMAMQLRSLEDRATNALRLKVDTVGVQALLDGVKKHLEDKGYQLPLNLCEATQHQTLTCDPERMRALLTSSITVLQPELRSTPLYLALEDTELHYPLPSIFEGYVKKIPAIRLTVATRAELPAVKEHYEPQFKEEMAHPETAREVVLVENRRVVRAHYGATEVHPGMLCYVIPVDVREVRPKDLDKPHMELGAVPVRADDASDGAQAIEKLFLQEVAEKSDADLETVKWVVELIKWYHGPVKRKSGEPFYLHPISVARIVLDFNADEATILAALLHDTVEDTAMLLEDIEVTFGEETAGLIDRVTRLESHQKSSYKVQLNTEETLLMLEEAEDERALYVKVADRLHNMRTISAKPWSSQHRSAQETLDFFVPLCQGRLKLYDVAGELLRLSHAVLHKKAD